MTMEAKHSKEFGIKEKVLNYACQTYQLSRPSKVGAVMELIRLCQPKSFDDWEQWYFANAHTATKDNILITKETLRELGERLFSKITEIVKPQWLEVFDTLTEQDCIDYVYNLTINRTYDGYIREKSVVYDGLAKIFPSLVFEESSPELDHSGDVDFVAKVGNYSIGFQIKPTTVNSNFAGYSLTERMKGSFKHFTEKYGGKVFIVCSVKGEIANKEVVEDIKDEIKRLKDKK